MKNNRYAALCLLTALPFGALAALLQAYGVLQPLCGTVAGPIFWLSAALLLWLLTMSVGPDVGRDLLCCLGPALIAADITCLLSALLACALVLSASAAIVLTGVLFTALFCLAFLLLALAFCCRERPPCRERRDRDYY